MGPGQKLNDAFWLPSLSLVRQHLGAEPDLVKQALKFGEEGKLNLWQLGSYIDANPSDRIAGVKSLLEAGAPERARSLMRLSMFPQKTAQEITSRAADGELRIEDVIKQARDLESGQNFVALVSQQLQQGRSLAPSALERLAR